MTLRSFMSMCLLNTPWKYILLMPIYSIFYLSGESPPSKSVTKKSSICRKYRHKSICIKHPINHFLLVQCYQFQNKTIEQGQLFFKSLGGVSPHSLSYFHFNTITLGKDQESSSGFYSLLCYCIQRKYPIHVT